MTLIVISRRCCDPLLASKSGQKTQARLLPPTAERMSPCPGVWLRANGGDGAVEIQRSNGVNTLIRQQSLTGRHYGALTLSDSH